MFISHRYKVIFIHIQRTGGTSIQKVFEEMDPHLVKILPIDPAMKRTKHCFASDIQKVLDAHTFTTYTKFSVVRNPFDRMLSWYFMLRQGMGEGDRRIEATGKPLADGSDLLNRMMKFTKLKSHIALARLFGHFPNFGPAPLSLQPKLVGANVMNAVMRQAHTFEDFVNLPQHGADGLFERFYINQFEYIAKNDAFLVNHVLRYESLANDFADFAQKIGFDGGLAHVNKSRRDANYRSYYNEHSKEIIAQRFKRDIVCFDYCF